MCGVCQAPLSDKQSLKQHMRTHTGIKPYWCEICGSGFSCSTHLSRHRKGHDEILKFKCDLCIKAFAIKSNLDRHRVTHGKSPKFKCDKCTKAFHLQTILNQHKKVHQIKQHKCVTCSKRFTHSFHLRKHEIIHTGSKSFQCNICSRKFTRADNLTRHKIRTHMADSIRNIKQRKRSLCCAICHQKFANAKNFERHVIQHKMSSKNRRTTARTARGRVSVTTSQPEASNPCSVKTGSTASLPKSSHNQATSSRIRKLAPKKKNDKADEVPDDKKKLKRDYTSANSHRVLKVEGTKVVIGTATIIRSGTVNGTDLDRSTGTEKAGDDADDIDIGKTKKNKTGAAKVGCKRTGSVRRSKRQAGSIAEKPQLKSAMERMALRNKTNASPGEGKNSEDNDVSVRKRRSKGVSGAETVTNTHTHSKRQGPAVVVGTNGSTSKVGKIGQKDVTGSKAKQKKMATEKKTTENSILVNSDTQLTEKNEKATTSTSDTENAKETKKKTGHAVRMLTIPVVNNIVNWQLTEEVASGAVDEAKMKKTKRADADVRSCNGEANQNKRKLCSTEPSQISAKKHGRSEMNGSHVVNISDVEEIPINEPVPELSNCANILSLNNMLRYMDSTEQTELEPIFRCTRCHRRFPSGRHLTEHSCISSSDVSNFECFSCGIAFSSRQSLESHKCDDGDLVCGDCNATFSSVDSLHSHSCGRVTRRCLKCSRTFTSAKNLRQHKCSKARYECGGCNKAFFNLVTLQCHQCTNLNDEEADEQVSNPEVTSSEKENPDQNGPMDSDATILCPDSGNEFQCKDCDISFASRLDMVLHECQNGSFAHRCQRCNISFTVKEHLDMHICQFFASQVPNAKENAQNDDSQDPVRSFPYRSSYFEVVCKYSERSQSFCYQIVKRESESY